jgi:7-cyano-7-deazaguanine reductase
MGIIYQICRNASIGDKMSIPVYGSMTRPANPQEGIAELKEQLLLWSGQEIEISFESNEFTSVCPKTGQPDFNRIKIEYTPNEHYIESKAMKFYLWSFRDFGIHCEHLADKIAKDLFDVVHPKRIKVTIFQNPRGGVSLVASRTILK